MTFLFGTHAEMDTEYVWREAKEFSFLAKRKEIRMIQNVWNDIR